MPVQMSPETLRTPDVPRHNLELCTLETIGTNVVVQSPDWRDNLFWYTGPF